MGQRHQFFVIARVRPHQSNTPRYRCVAAAHHQWCYGRLPPKAVDRFMALCRNPLNARLILADLQAVDGCYGVFKTNPAIPKEPCKYISLLLGLATNYGREEADENEAGEVYASGISFPGCVMNAGMGCWDGDNNDGITIIDITDPFNPGYCFFSGNQRGPLEAEEYMREYYPKPQNGTEGKEDRQMEASIQGIVTKLAHIHLIKPAALAEAWPRNFAQADSEDSQTPLVNQPTAEVRKPLSALSDLSLAPAIKHAIETDDVSGIVSLLYLPGKGAQIKAIIAEQVSFPASAVELLLAVISDDIKPEGVLDLAHFQFSPNGIFDLISGLPNNITVKVLDLSHTSADEAVIRRILPLPALRQLERLIVLGCSSLTGANVTSLLTYPSPFAPLHQFSSLIHPSMFRGIAVKGVQRYSNAFGVLGGPVHSPVSLSIPFLQVDHILNIVLEFLPSLADYSMSEYPLFSAMASAPKKVNQAHAERGILGPPARCLDLSKKRIQGWVFGFRSPMFRPEEGCCGFIRAKPPTQSTDPSDIPQHPQKGNVKEVEVKYEDVEIHSVRSFVEQLELQGHQLTDLALVDILEEMVVQLGMRLVEPSDLTTLRQLRTNY